jgi:hypothetical protein
MRTYYCNECARFLGELESFNAGSVLGTTYQQDKFSKHTVPSTSYPLASVWVDPSTSAYEAHIVSAGTSGSLEIDERGRKNLIVFAGRTVGALHDNGRFVLDQDSVKVVKHSASGEIHAYPTNSAGANQAICARCGKPTPT